MAGMPFCKVNGIALNPFANQIIIDPLLLPVATKTAKDNHVVLFIAIPAVSVTNHQHNYLHICMLSAYSIYLACRGGDRQRVVVAWEECGINSESVDRLTREEGDRQRIVSAWRCVGSIQLL